MTPTQHTASTICDEIDALAESIGYAAAIDQVRSTADAPAHDYVVDGPSVEDAAESLPHRDWCGGRPCACKDIRLATVVLVLEALSIRHDGSAVRA